MNAIVIARELETQGYSVVRGFLSHDDVSPELLAFLTNAAKFSDGVINDIPNAEMLSIRRKIESLVPVVAAQLGLSVSHDRFKYCAIRINEAHNPPVLRRPFDMHRDPKVAPGGVLNWHLDHFSYFLYGDHENWLICYMPVMKPSREFTNLAIIPTSTLASVDADLQRRIQGRGAMRFRCVEEDTIEWFKLRFPGQEIKVGDWFAIDDYRDATMGWRINIDLERHKVVPELEQFDLLIMRADVIHRTNDAANNRISLRCDAMPLHSSNLETWAGLLKMTLRFPFLGRKRRYNLRNWLGNEWKKRLA